MKRILHALAALWPERREYHNTWLPDARNGLLRHAVAVLRVEHAMEELALCKEPKTQPANAPDADTAPQTNDEPNNRLNLTSRLAGRRITVPGTSEIASLPAKANLRIRVFANLQMACALATALFMCLTARGQDAPRVLPITGTVVDTLGQPIQGVTVSIKETSIHAQTDEYGRFAIRGTVEGHQRLVRPHQEARPQDPTLPISRPPSPNSPSSKLCRKHKKVIN